tara:strand:+ start:97506 stop:97790 length:285 start_codon:yes stop_codon:yes gene_type:complete
MSNVNEIFQNVTKLNDDEYRAFVDMIRTYNKTRQNAKQLQAAAKFEIGNTVKFTASRGLKVEGVIIKINTKTIKVKANNTDVMWSVSPTLLSVA